MSYVYAITDGDMVKIGTSRDPRRRLRDLQGASPNKLWIEWIGVGGTDVESALHEVFADYRVHGEWFDLRDLIAEDWSIVAHPLGTLMQTMWATWARRSAKTT